MITGLSDLLRRTLDLRDTQEIPLQGELELLTAYVDIQKTRFGDRLDVRLDIDSDARAAAVPMLLLQPLVENAIRHGVATHLSSGRVDVIARRINDLLTLIVANDGTGGSTRPASNGDARVGIGLANTRARLDALYGGSARLELDTQSAHGARIIVTLPYRAAAGA